MNWKYLLILIATFLFLLFISGFVLLSPFGVEEPIGGSISSGGGGGGSGGSTSSSSNESSITQTSQTYSIATSSVASSAFATSSDSVGNTMYFIGPSEAVEAMGHSFVIQYTEGKEEFLIALESEPLSESREHAEKRFFELFDVPARILCTLPVEVRVSIHLNPVYAGDNLGLSFCPDSVLLP